MMLSEIRSDSFSKATDTNTVFNGDNTLETFLSNFIQQLCV